MPPGSLEKIRIWDLPTRLFHWGLASAVIGMVITGKLGGDAMVWHARLGYCVGALIFFRLVWGFLGGHWSRFSSFSLGLRGAWTYLRGNSRGPAAGHNPLGALSVYAMLGFLLLQFASGLFSETKDDFAGPLAVLASNDIVHWLTGYHKKVGQWVLIILVVAHIAAIAYYALRGRDLVTSMVSGDKRLDPSVPPSRDDLASRLAALLVLGACAALVTWLVSLGGG